MKTVEVLGASDDLVIIKGEIDEEFSCYEAGEIMLAIGDGTLLRVRYTDLGCWRIDVVSKGAGSEISIYSCPEDDEGDYSDRVTIQAERIPWALVGKSFAMASARG